MSTKPDVSDEELREYMNFDELLDRRKAAVQKMKAIDLLRKAGILSAAIITLSVVWFTYRGGTGEEQVTQKAGEMRATPEPDELPAANEQHNSSDAEARQDLPLPVTPEGHGKAGTPGNIDANQPPVPAQSNAEGDAPVAQESDATEYEYAEAEPVDGFPALYEYFNKELVYPRTAIGDSVQGVVTASFVIGISGAPENIQIENSLGELFDDEVKRLIENMPPWTPAQVNGKPVPSRLSIPITFQLQKVGE